MVRQDALVLPRCVNIAGLLCIVSFDYVRVHRVWQVVAIHGGQNHGSTREYAFDHKWSFVCRSLFAPGITLRQYDALDHHIPDLIHLASDLLLKALIIRFLYI